MGSVSITVQLEKPPMLLEEVIFETENPLEEGMKKIGELHRQYNLSLVRRSETHTFEGSFIGALLLRWQDELQ